MTTLAALLEALRARPEDVHLLLNAAAHARREGDIVASSALYMRCYRVYQAQGEAERAAGCLRQLVRFDPDHSEARALLERGGESPERPRKRLRLKVHQGGAPGASVGDELVEDAGGEGAGGA